jgi:hypothetical protein
MRPVSMFAKGPGSIPARRAAAYDRSRTQWLSLEPVLSEATDWMARKRACGGACSTSSTSI